MYHINSMRGFGVVARAAALSFFFCSAAALTVTVTPDHATGQFSVLVDGRVWFAAGDTPVSLHGAGPMLRVTPLTVQRKSAENAKNAKNAKNAVRSASWMHRCWFLSSPSSSPFSSPFSFLFFSSFSFSFLLSSLRHFVFRLPSFVFPIPLFVLRCPFSLASTSLFNPPPGCIGVGSSLPSSLFPLPSFSPSNHFFLQYCWS